jgi:hypothetical protein
MVLLYDRLVGLYFVYSPNTSINRCTLWEWMDSSLTVAHWIIRGNFNMVEWERDRDGVVGSIISSVEKQAWSR